MNTEALLESSLFLQLGLTVVVLTTLLVRRAHRVFPQLPLLLMAQAIPASVSLCTLFFRQSLHLGLPTAYKLLFSSTWICAGSTLVLRIFVVYAIFAEAMRPMAGLHQAGKMIFRWVAVVSGLVALALVAGPGVFSSVQALTDVFSRLQQGVSVLTLCLLVFVCFAVRPLGLTFRSHLFGVSLGLGVAALVELVQAAWLVTYGGRSLYSPIYAITSLGICLSIGIWGVYFGAPEPARQMILLPTTSPFFFWNRISEILGDAPGQVAIAGFTPDMLAPAELEMLTSASTLEDSPAEIAEPAVTRPAIKTAEPKRITGVAGSVSPSLA